MERPRWIADEMVGRLARYLRFVGCDTVYARGLADQEIVDRARSEGRIVVTRDRDVARRADRAVLLESPEISEQWKALRRAVPELPSEVRFDRCSECNGPLVPYVRGTDPLREAGLPAGHASGTLSVFSCAGCGHLYWEGSHTAQIRDRIRAWSEERAK